MATQETYTIGDAAKQIHVEAHVLRYWEEELGIRIGRNEQGYRCYKREDIELMEKVRQWKEQGLQLKAIRLMLLDDGTLAVPEQVVREAQAMMEKPADKTVPAMRPEEEIAADAHGSRAARLQFLLENLVSRAVQQTGTEMIKELDLRFAQMEEKAQERERKQLDREEAHYKKLDELLCQRGRRNDKRKKRRKFS